MKKRQKLLTVRRDNSLGIIRKTQNDCSRYCLFTGILKKELKHLEMNSEVVEIINIRNR